MSVVAYSVVGMDQRTGPRADAPDGLDGVGIGDAHGDLVGGGGVEDGCLVDAGVGSGVGGLGVAGLCAVLVEQHGALLAAQARQLRLMGQWADLHGPETVNR